MITDENAFWLTALVCTVIMLITEAVLGYRNQLWYFKYGLPLPFSRAAVSLAFGRALLPSRRFYVGHPNPGAVTIRYRFLGNFDPSFIKGYLVAQDGDTMRAYATLNWWTLVLLGFALLGAFSFGHLFQITLFLLLSFALIAGQLRALKAFLRLT